MASFRRSLILALMLLVAALSGSAVTLLVVVFLSRAETHSPSPLTKVENPKPTSETMHTEGETDQSPITDTDLTIHPQHFCSPLSLGMVGVPYYLQILTVVDDKNAVAIMRIDTRLSDFHNEETVWAVVPTYGMVTGHKYFFDEKTAFKIVGTRNYVRESGGEMTVYVVKPLK